MSLRVRLALAVALATLAVGSLASVGLYLSTEATIRQALVGGLRTSAGHVEQQLVRHVLRLGSSSHPARSRDQQFLQIFDARGSMVYTTSAAGPRRSLDRAEIDGATGAFTFVRISHAVDGSTYLASVASVDVSHQRFVVVVASSLDQLDDSTNKLRSLLLAGMPICGLLAYVAALILSGRALRPVERLRIEAEALRVAHASERLQVPATKDELSSLAQTLNAFLDDVGSLVERQRVFVASASHELRGPLARLRADLELALSPRTDAGQTRRLVTMAAATVVDLSRLCDGLLAIASAQSPSLEVASRRTELGPFLVAVLERFKRPADARGVDLVLDLDDGLLVLVDPAHFSRVIENVVDNAMRYAGPGTAVVIASRDRGDMVEVSVADEGPGFPSHFVARALEPFARADAEEPSASSAVEGSLHTGLGLAIAALIAELHAGRVEAGNRDEGGAIVRIFIPSGSSYEAKTE